MQVSRAGPSVTSDTVCPGTGKKKNEKKKKTAWSEGAQPPKLISLVSMPESRSDVRSEIRSLCASGSIAIFQRLHANVVLCYICTSLTHWHSNGIINHGDLTFIVSSIKHSDCRVTVIMRKQIIFR